MLIKRLSNTIMFVFIWNCLGGGKLNAFSGRMLGGLSLSLSPLLSLLLHYPFSVTCCQAIPFAVAALLSLTLSLCLAATQVAAERWQSSRGERRGTTLKHNLHCRRARKEKRIEKCVSSGKKSRLHLYMSLACWVSDFPYFFSPKHVHLFSETDCIIITQLFFAWHRPKCFLTS